MEGYNIIKKYNTKRNKVFLAERLGKKYIIKRYLSLSSLESEFKVLRALQGKANVPRAIHRLDNEVVMEYIPGDSLAKCYSDGNILEMPALAVRFAKFLKAFGAALPGYIINDVNYRNYIISDGVCYGLDFEFITEGSIERTAAEAIAFGLLANIDDDKKKMFLKSFIKEMGISLDKLEERIKKELIKRARNSGLKINADDLISLLK